MHVIKEDDSSSDSDSSRFPKTKRTEHKCKDEEVIK